MAIDKVGVTGLMRLAGFSREQATGKGQRVVFGGGAVPKLEIDLAFGTGPDQVNKFYYGSRVVAGTTFDLVDLSGSLLDATGATIAFTAIKLAVLAITTPNGTLALRVGPQNQSNAFVGSWGGTGATVYKTVRDWELIVNDPVAGFPVAAGTGDIFPVYNPGALAVTYNLLLAGV